MTELSTSHIPLGESGWSIWRDCQLRSAGLPANLLDQLVDEGLAAALAEGDLDAITLLYAAATERLSVRMQSLASNPLLQEAVTWQNYPARIEVLDKLAEGRAGKPWATRRREQKLASYLQRYALKNETIGFFGPVGWASVTTSQEAIVCVTVGDALTQSRTVFFEQWAIDQVANTLCKQQGIKPWLTPTKNAANHVDGNTIHRPRGGPYILTELEQRIYHLSDGYRTVTDIQQLLERHAGDASVSPKDALDALVTANVLGCSLEQPLSATPELALGERLSRIEDPLVREANLQELNKLVDAKHRVAQSAGNADSLLEALLGIDAVFRNVTGEEPERRPGDGYAGRRIVYEDTRRDFDVTFGSRLIEALAAPLDVVLRTARWLVDRVSDAYSRRLGDIFDAKTTGSGNNTVAFPVLLSSATPDFAFSFRELSDIVSAELPEFQKRWAAVLDLTDWTTNISVAASAIESRVAEHFPSPKRPPLRAAVHYSPDILVLGNTVEQVNSVPPRLVLGELHLAQNTLDQRASLGQHRNPDALIRADMFDRGGFRVLPVPFRDGYDVNTRIYPPAMVSPDYTYWTVHQNNTGAPGRIQPGAGMVIRREGLNLKVCMPNGGADIDLLDIVTEYVAAAVMNAFRPFAKRAHNPRVTIDCLVVSRESWSCRTSDLEWAHAKEAGARYRQAIQWKSQLGLPRRLFYRTIMADKPVFIDFASPVLVEMLASTVRRSAVEDPESHISLSEMLPDVGEQWLPDRKGDLYCSEIRLVVVDDAVVKLHNPKGVGPW